MNSRPTNRVPTFHRRAVLPTMVALLALSACRGDDAAPAAPVVAPTDPQAVGTPPPDYPLELACAGIDGQTTLQLTIGPDGRITGSRLERGSGSAALDRLAQDAVKQWRFEPATRGGQPIEARIRVPITFNAPAERPQACFALDAGRAPAQ